MSSIKKYHRVNAEDDSVSFDIKRMEEVYDQHLGHPDHPHRHDYYTVLVVKSAKGKHTIDFHQFALGHRQIFFINPGQVHQVEEESRPSGSVLTFSPNFLTMNGIDRQFIADLHLFKDYGHAPPIETGKDVFEEIFDLCEQMMAYKESAKKNKYLALGALLKLFLLESNNACDRPTNDNPQNTQAAVVLLKNFKQTLDDYFVKWHKVGEYAQHLHITPDYLNASVKALTGLSAKEHIQSRIITAAKRELYFTDSTTKEIAYQLGFSEPANFSQFFKKCTGISPSVFRKAH